MRFSQIGLILEKKWLQPILLKINMVQVVFQNWGPKIYRKNNHFGLILVNQNYSKLICSLTDKTMSLQAFYIAQQNLTRFNLYKWAQTVFKIFLRETNGVLYSKNDIFWLWNKIKYVYTKLRKLHFS